MRVPRRLLELLVWAPAGVVSFVFINTVLAILPPATTTPAFLVWVAVLVALARGHLEAGAGRALTWSRSATATEVGVLAPVLGLAAAMATQSGAAGDNSPGWGQLRVLVRHRRCLRDPAARLLGSGTVVVNPALVESVDRGWMTHHEAAAVLIYAEGTHQGERTRAEVAVLVATIPWRMVMGVCRPVLAAFTALPLGRLSWVIRGVLAVICVVQAFTVGQPVARIGGAAVIVVTYAIPAAARALRRRTELAADLQVVRVGLGPVWLRFLQRTGHRIDLERRHRLQAATAHTVYTANTAPQHSQEPAAQGPATQPGAPAIDGLPTRPRLWLVPTS